MFETAALLNVREKDIEQFQRHIAMLKPYYIDFGLVASNPLDDSLLG